MAEGLFRQAAKEKGYAVSSAGVSAYDGSPASSETVSILETKGAALDSFASRLVSDEILEKASHVFCLTKDHQNLLRHMYPCLLYTSPSPRDKRQSRMPSSA